MGQRKRFTEDEISRIFEEAANEHKRRDEDEGLTLDELQSIGAASGLDPSAIARAADKIKLVLRLDPRKRFLKSDVGVSGKAVLPGKITVSDWEELVADIRHEMNAPGELTSDKYTKEWNGRSLNVRIENGREEDRISLVAKNSRRRNLIRLIAAVFGVGAFTFFIGILEGSEAIPIGLIMMLASFLTYWINRRGLRKWSDKMESKMVSVVEKAGDLARNKIDLSPALEVDDESAEEIMIRRVKESQKQ